MGTGTTRRSLRSAYCLVCALAAVLGPRSLSPAAPPGPLLRRLPELIRHAREREPEPSKSVLAVPSKSAITLTPDGIMTTVYVICVRPTVDHGAARRERDRVFRRRPFSTRGDFLATFTSQRLAFRALTLRQRLLMHSVVLPALVAPLVSGIRGPMKRGLLELAAIRGAIALPSVIRPADEEPLQASSTVQREDHELVHPSRRDENWTAISGSTTVRAYRLSIHRLYMRVQAPTWTLLHFTPPSVPTGAAAVARVFELDDIRMKLLSEIETKAAGIELHKSLKRTGS